MAKHDKPAGLPNLRKMFIPDPGFILIEADLERADAHIVAWEAGDEALKKILREGGDIHTQNALDIWGRVDDRIRDDAKVGVHAVNYVCGPQTLAEHIGSSLAAAEEFSRRWFRAHPRIADWHRRVELDLITRSCVSNAWGYKRHYTLRPGASKGESVLPEACAWIGQSTTAITCHKGMIEVDRKGIIILNEDHDSLLMQIKASDFCDAALAEIKSAMSVEIPFPDPCTIGVGMKWSEKSWGDLKKWKPGESTIGTPPQELAPQLSALYGTK